MKRLLCFIGLHDRAITLLGPAYGSECSRCGRQWVLLVRYSEYTDNRQVKRIADGGAHRG